MENLSPNTNEKAGTLGGTFLTILLLRITTDELVKTILLAAVGAAVSYLVSFSLQRLVNRNRR